MFLDLSDLHIPILHVPLDSWLGMIRNKRQRTDEFRECTTNAARGQTVKCVIDKAPTIVLRNSPSISNEDVVDNAHTIVLHKESAVLRCVWTANLHVAFVLSKPCLSAPRMMAIKTKCGSGSVDRAVCHAQVGKRSADQVLVKCASNCGFFSGKGKGPNGIHGGVPVLVILKVAGVPWRSKFDFLGAGDIELLLGAGVIELRP
jgi:hypothetical protein